MKKVMGTFSRFLRPIISCFLLSSNVFWKFSAFKIYEKISGLIFTIFASKNEAICCEVQVCLRSSLPTRFPEKSYGHIFMIYVSKNEAVSCEVQTHLGSFHFARFIKKDLGTLSGLLHPNTKLFALEFRCILGFLYWKLSP